ncbi:phage tail protein [Neorhizobium alkalisoli]|uniref:Putative tail protein n=1 Tax=Neorhizobium alkalisoli TaxID=528178 RepID=A0A561QSJ0_9HYPH|nr:hypothetical protein [Neorhizobium alkalisoli]TWF53272.1 putative tail protein [Neorhizobium alkalisoli]
MKFTRIILLASAAYVGATPAHAEPISFAIFSALYTIGVPGAIANAISLIAVPALAVGASLLGAKSVPGIKASDAKSTFETSEAQVQEGIGRVRVGGVKAFGNSDGSTRARLICRLQGPIDAIEEYFIGGREVAVDDDGNVTSPPWSRQGGSWANWKNKIGTGNETAWGGLMSLFPTLWTTDHQVRGIFQSLILWYNPGLKETKYFTLYQGGVPDTEQTVRASLIYDPRDSSQSGTDRSTWKWSDNGILACAHVLRRDSAFLYSMFDWDLIAAEATKADALVATKTGTRKRARACGVWGWETARADVMQQLMDSVGVELRVTDAGKIWFQLIDDTHVSEIDFTPSDNYELTWRSGPEAVERPNICRITFYSAERNYDSAEIDLTGIAWASVEDEITRYGEKYLDIDLPFCPDAGQAQVIGRRKFVQARADTGVMNLDMVGLAAWGCLYGKVTLPDLGDVLPLRLEAPRVDDDQGMVEIPFSVWPALPAWNPTTMEAVAPAPIPDFGSETDLVTPAAPTAALQITYPDGSRELRISFALPSQDYDVAEANYRVYTSGLPASWQGMVEYPNANAATMAWAGGDATGRTIDARVRVFKGDDGSYFSPYLTVVPTVSVTAPAAPTVVTAVVGGTDTSATLTGTFSAPELRTAALRLQRRTRANSSAAWGSFVTISNTNVRPGQVVTIANTYTGSLGNQVEWQIQSIVSDGSAGPARTYSRTIASS